MNKKGCLCRNFLENVKWFFTEIFPNIIFCVVLLALIFGAFFIIEKSGQRRGFKDGLAKGRMEVVEYFHSGYEKGLREGKSSLSISGDLHISTKDSPDHVISYFRLSDYPYLQIQKENGYWTVSPVKSKENLRGTIIETLEELGWVFLQDIKCDNSSEFSSVYKF